MATSAMPQERIAQAGTGSHRWHGIVFHPIELSGITGGGVGLVWTELRATYRLAAGTCSGRGGGDMVRLLIAVSATERPPLPQRHAKPRLSLAVPLAR